MFNAESEDEKLQCPFDITHSVIRKHFQTHLLRCRKNHPDVEVVKCPFNVSHIMPEANLLNHVATCPDRKLIAQYQGPVEDDCVNTDIKHAPIDDDENWDDENNSVPDFKPTIFSAMQVKREN